MKRVLVLSNELQSRNFLIISLERNGYEVRIASANHNGLDSIHTIGPDIVILELRLSNSEGVALITEIRSISSIPIIVLSIAGLANEIAALLNGGADDFMTIPFNVEELLARMNVVMYRAQPIIHEPPVACGDLTVDLDTKTVSVGDHEINLTPAECTILASLTINRGKTLTMAKIFKDLWGPLAIEEQGSLHDHIVSIREKIERDSTRPEYIINEHGVGYSLSCSQSNEWFHVYNRSGHDVPLKSSLTANGR